MIHLVQEVPSPARAVGRCWQDPGRASALAVLALAGLVSFGCGSSSSEDEACRGVRVAGEVAGDAVSARISGSFGSAVLGGTDWRVHASSPGTLFWGEGVVPSSNDPTLQGTGYLLGYSLAFTQMLTGKLSVTRGTGSSTAPDLSQPAALTDLQLLGACPGAPVDGSLEVCITSNIVKNPDQCSGSTSSLTGTLDGQPIALASSGSGMGLGAPSFGTMVLLEDHGVRAYVTNKNSVVLMPPSGPRANEVLCATAVRSEDSVRETWALADISVAGSLPGSPAAGDLEFQVCSP